MPNFTSGLTTAATGASIGSAFGPLGTAIGGGVGFLGGLLGGGERRNRSKPDPSVFPDAQRRLDNFAQQSLAGQVDPVAQNALIASLNRQVGSDFARRGLGNSTIAGSAVASATAQALANQQLARQQLGAQLTQSQIVRGDVQQQQRLAQAQQRQAMLGDILQHIKLLNLLALESSLLQNNNQNIDQNRNTKGATNGGN